MSAMYFLPAMTETRARHNSYFRTPGAGSAVWKTVESPTGHRFQVVHAHGLAYEANSKRDRSAVAVQRKYGGQCEDVQARLKAWAARQVGKVTDTPKVIALPVPAVRENKEKSEIMLSVAEPEGVAETPEIMNGAPPAGRVEKFPFPPAVILNCEGCGNQVWFYPHAEKVPATCRCWKCRGQKVNTTPVQMRMF